MKDRTSGGRLFLIGSEASRAVSPDLWNPVLEQLGMNWRYEGWDVPAGQPLEGIRARLLECDVVAANITMPHKQWAARTADTVTESVRLSGASNLLVRHDGTLAAHNTDITAATLLIGNHYQRHVLIFGAGGAARAALIALRGQAARVTVTDQDPEASQQLLALAESLGMDAATTATWADAQVQAPHASLIVNATPIGKHKDDEPVWGQADLAPDAFVYDFVYAGHVTGSIAVARERGLQCADGWDHLREQAVAMIPILGLAPQGATLLRRRTMLMRIKS